MTAPTPLLDFFKRREVARDVRLLAAQGVLAPRAHEQLGILILLVDDPDPEIRTTAEETLARIPGDSLTAFLGRADVAINIREFFADRGIFPAEIPSISAEEPLISAETALPDAPEDPAKPEALISRIAQLGFTERLKLAMRGTREARAILIRDPNKMIAASVLSSPKVSESEVEAFARMANVSEEVLRTIGTTRSWLKNYSVVVGLTRNPKTPLGMSLNFLPRLNDRDLTQLSVDRNVPESLRIAARKKLLQGKR